MDLGTRLLVALAAAALISTPAVPTAGQNRLPEPGRDYDIRDGRKPVAPRAAGHAGVQTDRNGRNQRARFNRDSGTTRVLDAPGFSVSPGAPSAAVHSALAGHAALLGLDPRDLATLVLVRDYASTSTGIRHVVFRQVVENHPVFDSLIAIHLRGDGEVLRVTSNAAPADGRASAPGLPADAARRRAEEEAAGMASAPTLAWLPVDGVLRLAWHATVSGGGDAHDVLIDATTAELLVRRSRTRDAQASGRILQSSASAASRPGQPDAMPLGADGTVSCPPPANYHVRPFDTPFRDPATVIAGSGQLEGNNVKVFRGPGGPAASGTFADGAWSFDFPFNSAASAETFLFFAANFTHDFFYELGFDEAAGNFQVDNFGRGGAAGDPLKVNARAPGRNNANYAHAVDGASPTINMFLWDGTGCWAADVNGDSTPDLDGDYDLDIFVHEYHHGVSLRLNTTFTGTEAGAIGEGGSDFFAYSVNDDILLAEYSRPGGLRSVNGKGYADWSCLLGLFCEVHDNGEIWANVLWDVRERFTRDLVRGAVAAAVNESHQLYIDGLKLSPPSPTMLDMRDAMLLADTARNGGTPVSENFCRLWESFAGRGMGVSARDTEDNGLNSVTAAYDVPAGCVAPPSPPAVSIAVTVPTAFEAQAVEASVTISRETASPQPLIVSFVTSGIATAGADYLALSGRATIPAGTATVVVPIVPVDDAIVENVESVSVTLTGGAGYTVGFPASATVTIVSDDVAPDLVVSALTAPAKAGAGMAIQVSDTTRNQGSGAAGTSQTSFYLSKNAFLDAADPLVGTRTVPGLDTNASSTAPTTLTLPEPLESGTYFLFARADAPSTIVELSDTNNTRAAAIGIGPDLVVTALSAPATAASGATIAVTDTTANQGAGAAAGSTTRFYLSNNPTFDAADQPLEARTIGPLAGAGTSTAVTTVTIPGGLSSGTYYLFARADAGGSIVELAENNNTRSAVVRIGADLIVSALTAPSRGAAGGTLSVTDTTRNSGAGPATGSTTAFYLSTNLILDAGDMRLEGGRGVGPLGPSELSTGVSTVTVPNVAPGTWFLLANADDGNVVAETSETNNARFAAIQIGPDLMFVSAAVPSTAVAGATVSATTIVKNAGAAPAAASSVRFYLSSNTVFDPADIALDALRPVPALGPDASHSSATSVPLPGGTTGSFYLLMVVDAAQQLPESNENNNIVARLMTIGPGS